MRALRLVDIVCQPQSIAAIALCLTLLTVIHRRLTRASKLPLPPGPPGNILFGNSIPAAFAYRKFEEWTQEYGPVFSLRQGFSTIIVVGRLQAAMDIMEKEGAAVASRPRNIAAGEILSGGMRVVMTPAGEHLKKLRRALYTHLQPKVTLNYYPTLMKNAKNHILDIIERPDKHQDHAKRYSASVIKALAYGTESTSYTDPDIHAVNRALDTFGNTVRPGVWKVDAYPFLRYIPGYLRELKDGHAEELGLFTSKISELRLKIKRGEQIPDSFGKYLLEKQSELELSDNEVAYLAGGMFGAGSDTTASAISITVLAAACYPKAQAKVQEELDAVVGRERAPTFADQQILPQTMAFVLESFRWRPVPAGGFAHKTTKDVSWGNYVIPEGASVIGNIWSIGRDPAYFPDPERFDPQKWLTEDGKIKEELKAFSFGFGRRVCPGQHVATASLFLNTALIQWAFKIKQDPSSPIDEFAFTLSANTHPKPFKVVFEPRAAMSFQGVRNLMEDYGL